MISNEERREVAQKLRSLDESIDGVPLMCTKQVHDAMVLRAIRAVVGKGDIFHLLADLIEPQERTCTNESASGKYFKCSECGAELMQITPGWVALVSGRVNYCPSCGARVTGGARIMEVVE